MKTFSEEKNSSNMAERCAETTLNTNHNPNPNRRPMILGS